jgi:hypothetical protein
MVARFELCDALKPQWQTIAHTTQHWDARLTVDRLCLKKENLKKKEEALSENPRTYGEPGRRLILPRRGLPCWF